MREKIVCNWKQLQTIFFNIRGQRPRYKKNTRDILKTVMSMMLKLDDKKKYYYTNILT